MIGKRFFAAAIMISTLAGALWLDLYHFKDSLMLHLIFMIGMYFSFKEFWVMCRATGNQTFSIWGTYSGCALAAVHYYSMHLLNAPVTVEHLQTSTKLLSGGLAIAVLGTFLLSAGRKRFDSSLGGVSVTSLGLLYVYFLPSFILKLRHMNVDGTLGGQPEVWNSFGHKMAVSTIALAKGCDVWAFLVGKLVGRHKAFPSLSPGKTVEGLIGGLVGSVLMGLAMQTQWIGLLSNFSPFKAAVIGFFIGLSGIFGDLTESLLKRSAGAKDAGQIVPGYGGALDVVDSLMVAGPVAYFLIPAML